MARSQQGRRAATRDQDREARRRGDGLWAPARRSLTVGLVLTVTLVAFEALAVITILPEIKDDLGGLRLYGWVTSAFFLGTLVGIVVAGGEADRRGPAPPYLLGIVLFGAGLVLGGLAPSMLVLVLARGLQGLGAGAIPAVAYASIGRTYPEPLRPRVFAVLATAWVVPGLVGPAISALVATHLDWRYVFLGLLPLVAGGAALSLPGLRRIGPPPEPASSGPRLLDALRVAVGAGLLLAGFTSRSPLLAVPLAGAGLLVGMRPLLRLLPAGTLRARRGLPVAILARGLLTFSFFGADTYVPLAITAAKGRSTATASAAVTAATLSWTLGAWVQERKARTWTNRRLVRTGMTVVIAGIALVGVDLLPALPAALAIAGWGVAGLGIGLAYSQISVTILGLAPSGQHGRASAQLQLSDTLGTALGAGVGGAFVAAGDAAGWAQWAGIAGAFCAAGAVGITGVVLTRRLPVRTIAGPGDVPGAAPGKAA